MTLQEMQKTLREAHDRCIEQVVEIERLRAEIERLRATIASGKLDPAQVWPS